MPLKTLDQIKEAAKHPFLKHDVMQAAIFELFTFLKYEDLPDFFKKAIERSGHSEKSWNNALPSPSYDELTSDIRDEVHALEGLRDNVDNSFVCRLPRVVALLWVRGADDSFVEKMDKRMKSLLDNPTKSNIDKALSYVKSKI